MFFVLWVWQCSQYFFYSCKYLRRHRRWKVNEHSIIFACNQKIRLIQDSDVRWIEHKTLNINYRTVDGLIECNRDIIAREIWSCWTSMLNELNRRRSIINVLLDIEVPEPSNRGIVSLWDGNVQVLVGKLSLKENNTIECKGKIRRIIKIVKLVI